MQLLNGAAGLHGVSAARHVEVDDRKDPGSAMVKTAKERLLKVENVWILNLVSQNYCRTADKSF